MSNSAFTANLRRLASNGSAAMLISVAAAASASAPSVGGPPAPRVGYVDVLGLDVHYQVHGELSAGEPPFLVLHGGMGSIAADFGELLPALARTRAVVGIEQQGHGRTGDRAAPITLASMRADTIAVLDALGIEQVHVVGFSIGGMLALDLGVHAPERVATLTALSVSQNQQGMHPGIVQMNRDPAQPPPPEVTALLPTPEDFAAMQEGFADNPSGPGQFERTMQALLGFMNSGWGWSDDELASIRAPVLLAVGDHDFMPVEHVASMATRIPRSQLAVLPDTTHGTITRRPGWLVPMIENRVVPASP